MFVLLLKHEWFGVHRAPIGLDTCSYTSIQPHGIHPFDHDTCVSKNKIRKLLRSQFRILWTFGASKYIEILWRKRFPVRTAMCGAVALPIPTGAAPAELVACNNRDAALPPGKSLRF